MKISTLLRVVALLGCAMGLVSGCSSSAGQGSVSAAQRESQTTGAKNIPAPAQNLALQQNQRKNEMDAMRAKDASAAR